MFCSLEKEMAAYSDVLVLSSSEWSVLPFGMNCVYYQRDSPADSSAPIVIYKELGTPQMLVFLASATSWLALMGVWMVRRQGASPVL